MVPDRAGVRCALGLGADGATLMRSMEARVGGLDDSEISHRSERDCSEQVMNIALPPACTSLALTGL